MTTYTVTIRSILYASYEIEAETEAEARQIAETQSGLCEVHSWTEDTEIYDITPNEEKD